MSPPTEGKPFSSSGCRGSGQSNIKPTYQPDAKLYPRELVTIGMLFGLKRDHDDLFGGLPERTRLQRLLATHQNWCDRFLAEPTFFTVADSYPVELLFPIRQGRSEQQIGAKGRDKGRWTVGVRLWWLLDNSGQVVEWAFLPLNRPDKAFNPV